MKSDAFRWTSLFSSLLALVLAGYLTGCGTPAAQSDGTQVSEEVAAQDPASEEAPTQDDSATQNDAATQDAEEDPAATTQDAGYQHPGEGYQLKQVVVLARHNIRAPLSTNGSALAQATTHEWIPWTADPSGLTLRGGVLETTLGQYVRQWLEAEELVTREWEPTEGQVRVYANSLQRTHATAQYFVAGMLPTGDIPVETHYALNELDPTFIPYLTFVSDAYNDAALKEIAQMGGKDGMAGVAAGLAENFKLLEDVCDYKNSKGYVSGELTDLDTSDTGVVLELGKEPAMTGSLKTANQLADALILQYYEADDEHAAFGKKLSLEEWQQIAAIKDAYGDVLFTAPLVAANVAHPLLGLIGDELDTADRTFTFLCGHDSDISSVLAALQAEDYELPNSIEKKTPIGSMVMFEKWAGADGATYGRVRLVYQSVDQLRNITLLTGAEHPESYELSFRRLEKNDEGLYAYDDLRARLQSAEDAYDQILEEYADEAELDTAA
jgi:glucose-1-phosphatase